ncbi:18155_t:CDS:1, partial [Funneliformis geosporum]
APKDAPKETEEKEAPKDAPKEKEEKEAPKDEPKEPEVPKNAPKEKEALPKTPKETEEKATPKEAPKEAPIKAPKEIAIQNPKVIPKSKGIKVAQEKIEVIPIQVENNPKVSKGLGSGGKSAHVIDETEKLEFGKEKESKEKDVSTNFGAGDPNVFVANNKTSNHRESPVTNDVNPTNNDYEDDNSGVYPATPVTNDQVLNENNDQFQNNNNGQLPQNLEAKYNQYSSNSLMKLELFSNKFTFITVLLVVIYLFD